MPTNQEWAEVHAAALAELEKGKKAAAETLDAIKADIEHLRATAAPETADAAPAPEAAVVPPPPDFAVQAPTENAGA